MPISPGHPGSAAACPVADRRLVLDEITLRSLVEHMPQAVLVADLAGTVVLHNRKAQEQFGRELTQSDGMALGMYLPDQKTLCATEDLPLCRAIHGLVTQDRELFLPNANSAKGSWISASASPLFDAAGEQTGAILVCQDISERKCMENARDLALRNVKLLAEASKILDSTFDYRVTLPRLSQVIADSVALYCCFDLLTDGKLERLSFTSNAAAIQVSEERARELVPPLDGNHSIARTVRSSKPTVTVVDHEYIAEMSQVKDLDYGRILQSVKSIISVPICAREKLFGVLSIAFPALDSGENLELTSELAARAALAIEGALLHGAVLDSERKHRALAEVVPQFVWTCRPDGHCDYLNHRWVDYTGVPETEHQGAGWFSALHPDDVPRTTAAWVASMEGREPYDVEYRLRSATGEYRWFKARSSAMRDESGAVLRWFGTSTDIEDTKRIQQELARKTEQLAESNADLEQFAYSVAHDLREPLRTVTSFTQLLKKQLDSDGNSKTASLLQYIVGGTSQMDLLLHGLLSYATITAKQREQSPVDCNHVCSDAQAGLEAAIAESSATIVCEGLPTVPGNQFLLQQLFQNLISNAIKYHGTEPPLITISSSESPSHWTVAVHDNGMGIDPAHQDRIFGVFMRLHGREIPGAGLGLASCKRIVEKHGGHIWVESMPNVGSTFFFTISKHL